MGTFITTLIISSLLYNGCEKGAFVVFVACSLGYMENIRHRLIDMEMKKIYKL